MNYAKLLEISYFFTWHIFLEVGKTQDMPSKIWQTLGDALTATSEARLAQTYSRYGSRKFEHFIFDEKFYLKIPLVKPQVLKCNKNI